MYPFLGAQGDMDTVKKAADALQDAYKDAGFGTVLVDIPEQQVDDGVVRLRVIEGKLNRCTCAASAISRAGKFWRRCPH